MRITVKAFNELRHYAAGLPEDGGLEMPPGATVRDVLTLLGIPGERQRGLPLFRNGRPAGLETPLEAGDTLVTFSPMSGG